MFIIGKIILIIFLSISDFNYYPEFFHNFNEIKYLVFGTSFVTAKNIIKKYK